MDSEADEPLTTMHQVIQCVIHPNFFKHFKALEAARSILDDYKSALPLNNPAKQEIQLAFQELTKLMTDTNTEARHLMFLLVGFMLEYCMLSCDATSSRNPHQSNSYHAAADEFRSEILESIPVLVSELANYQMRTPSKNAAQPILLKLINECKLGPSLISRSGRVLMNSI
jgi:hypothetical protein